MTHNLLKKTPQAYFRRPRVLFRQLFDARLSGEQTAQNLFNRYTN
jgi:hypothetical protein